MRHLLLIFLFLISSKALGFEPPLVQEINSEKGYNIWLIEDHKLPLVSIVITFKNAGAAYDPIGKEGLASLVTHMLDEGTKTLPAKKFKEKMGATSSQFSINIDQDVITIRIRTLTSNAGDIMHLLGLMLTEPVFSEEALKKEKENLINALEKQMEDPESTADIFWHKAAFKDHPYGRNKLGSKAGIEAINSSDLSWFIKNNFTKDRMVISVVGDIALEKSRELFDDYINLPALSKIPALPAIPKTEGSVLHIERDIPQTVVAFGHNTISIDHPDYYPMFILNHIIGGGNFSSRLMQELREKRGLVYGIHTGIEMYEQGAMLTGSFASNPAQVREALDILKKIWQEAEEMMISQKELDEAKSYLTGSFALSLDSTAKLAERLNFMQLNKLGRNYIKIRNEKIKEVTLQAINKAAKSQLHPENMIILTLGKRI